MSDLLSTADLLDRLTAYGVQPPKKALLAVQMHHAALGAAAAHPSDDLRARLAAGTLTLENVGQAVFDAATALTAREKAHEIVRDLEHPLLKTCAEAIRADGDRLVKEMSKAFAKAAKVLQRAGELFPADATAEQVLAGSNEAADAWRELAAARRTLDDLRGMRMRLANGYSVDPVNPTVVMFTSGISDRAALEHAEELFRGSDHLPGGRWHALTAAGFTLHLAGPVEAAATLTFVARAEQAVLDQKKAARVAELTEANRGWLFPPTAPTAA